MAEALRPEDLTPLQYAVVAYLRDEPHIDQKGLAARLAVDRTNAGLLVDQLEDRGIVQRLPNPDDRRVWLLRLTPLGDTLFARLAPIVRAVQTNILERALTRKEANTLLDLLVRVIQANEELARPGGGRRKRARSSARPLDEGSPISTGH
jgi:DNA-binding MarR family transcriptional regulator